MKPLALLLAALCGAIIAVAFMPQSMPSSGDAPEMADNISELCSLRMAVENFRERVEERDLRMSRMVDMLTPAERMN